MRKTVAAALLLLGVVAGAAAQSRDEKKREAQLRTVRGTVIDKDDTPVPSSVVYLENLKTQAGRTYIADDKGQYRFSGLDPNVDYEIHAVHGNLESPKRSVSSLDSRKEIVIQLKLNKKKGK
jgi:protocatechuate 3,4-dioxygenase beta subunit